MLEHEKVQPQTTQEKDSLVTTQHFLGLVVIVLSGLFLFYKYVLQISPSIMFTQLEANFHLNGYDLGNLSAAYFYSYVIVQLIAGPIMDRFHPGKVAAVAILSCALGAFVFSKSLSFETAFLGRIFMGIGVAFATVCYMKMASIYCPPRHYAFVTGLLVSAAMAGAIFGETPLVILMQYMGWRGLLFLTGCFGIFLALLFIIFVKRPTEPHLNTEELTINTNSENAKTIRWSSLKDVFCSRKNWLLTLYSGFAYAPICVLGGLWANPFFQTTHHLNLIDSSVLVSAMFLGFGIGSPALGYLADRSKQYLGNMKVSVFLALILLIIILYIQNLSYGYLGILMFSFGFFSGGFMIGFVVAKEVNPLLLTATVVAMINTGDEFLSGITEPLIGKFLDLHWNGALINGVQAFTIRDFHTAFSVLPIYLLLSFLLLFFIKHKHE